MYIVACCRNSPDGGGSMFLKMYSITILLLDVLSLVVKVIFAILESICQTFTGVAEKPVTNEIVLVSVLNNRSFLCFVSKEGTD
jgi:hypothetical protein